MAVWVVTGASRGIGLELCRQLAADGHDVVGVCRERARALGELGVRVEEGIDVTDGHQVAELARRLVRTHVDVLVNNAGILESTSLETLDFDSVRRQFEVNALGPLRVTRALLPNLSRGAKVIIVTSLMGSMGDNSSGGYYGYRMSKAAVNSAGVSLARDLASQGIAVGILHPGMVSTDMTGHRGISVEESARGLRARIDELDLKSSGTFRHANGQTLPW